MLYWGNDATTNSLSLQVTEVDSILHDLINQLVSVSIPSDTMHRDEHIRNLTPIINASEGASAPNEPEGTFLVGKRKPKDAGTTALPPQTGPVLELVL